MRARCVSQLREQRERGEVGGGGWVKERGEVGSGYIPARESRAAAPAQTLNESVTVNGRQK